MQTREPTLGAMQGPSIFLKILGPPNILGKKLGLAKTDA